MIDRYINPLTDFGFKRLFGSEFNKELLISFLNAMFHGEQIIQDVTQNKLASVLLPAVPYSKYVAKTIKARSLL